MKLRFWCACMGIMVFLYSFCPKRKDQGLSQLLNKAQYEVLFPHHHIIYSFENLLEASKSFPRFVNEGSLINRKRELIAFLANVAHETANSHDLTYAWGLYYTEEQACKDGHCSQYNVAGLSNFKPVPGKSYYGRGPIQLSYAYNYGLAGKELGLPLLENPEEVGTNGETGFKTAIWFWMREQKPKPSCHDVMCGRWTPSAADSIRHWMPGFGLTINIINGGVECNSRDPAIENERAERIGFYKWFAKIMHIEVEEECDCLGMGVY